MWQASRFQAHAARWLGLDAVERASWTDPAAVLVAWVGCAGAVSAVTITVWRSWLVVHGVRGLLAAAVIATASLLSLLPTVTTLLRPQRRT
jgi:hypothetical protein